MKNIKYHLIGIAIYATWVMGLDLLLSNYPFKLYLQLVVLIEQVWIFYTGFYVLQTAFGEKGRRKLLTLPVLVLSVAGTIAITYLYELAHDVFYEGANYTWPQVVYSVTQIYTQVFLYSMGYYFFERYAEKQRKHRELLQEQHRLHEDLLRTENNFLRAQINPHFLYNCLNLFYAETFQQQPRIADAILRLSGIMRYSIHDFSKDGGWAKLEDELEHIGNVIDLNRFRFGENLQLVFQVEGCAQHKKFLPLVLITLVENGFKHGDLQDPEHPAEISAHIDEDKGLLLFQTVNKISSSPHGPGSGIGLANIEQRLRLHFQDRFELAISRGPLLFKSKLVVPFLVDPTQ